MSHSNLYTTRQRAEFISAARATSQDVFDAFAVVAVVVCGFGVFFAAPLCAVFGARLAAAYVFVFSLSVFGCLWVCAHVGRLAVFTYKTWNV
jgi:hypothetical protein|tara:strand:- start:1589 stop:1864 length:276 start_codon:yes stop_codon:yes gene_type:complete